MEGKCWRPGERSGGPLLVRTNFLPFPRLNRLPGFHAVTTTREGGFSGGAYTSMNLGLHVGDDPDRVVGNRQKVASGLELKRNPVCLNQVHGTELFYATKQDTGKGWINLHTAIQDCDGAVTIDEDLVLTIGHADCLAIVVADPARKAVGVAHAGWRGALGKIAEKLTGKMKQDFGSRVQDLWAGLSVCLGPCCLELSGKEHQAFRSEFDDYQAFCSPLEEGHFKLDLWSCCKGQLLKAGIPESQIEIQKFCTAHNPALFFSHRRDKGETGRMWTLAWFD
jgi:YfiH family protein